MKFPSRGGCVSQLSEIRSINRLFLLRCFFFSLPSRWPIQSSRPFGRRSYLRLGGKMSKVVWLLRIWTQPGGAVEVEPKGKGRWEQPGFGKRVKGRPLSVD